MYTFYCVLLSHLLEFLLSPNVSVQSCTDYHTPPSQPLASTLLADTKLLKLITAQPFCIQTPYGLVWAGSLFGFFSFEDGTVGGPEVSLRNYHFSMHNNPEQGSSLLKFTDFVLMYYWKTRNATWIYVVYLTFLNPSLSNLSYVSFSP